VRLKEELTPEGFIKALRERVADANGSDALLSVLRTTLATQGSSIQAVRLAIEKWFNDSMVRASGWYKRRTQVWLLAFGLLIAVGGHVDTIAISQWLWSGDAARQSVMAAAQSNAGRGNSAAAPPTAAEMKKYFTDVAEQMGEADRQITNLQYPISWYDPTKNQTPRLAIAVIRAPTKNCHDHLDGEHILVRCASEPDKDSRCGAEAGWTVGI